MNTLNLNNLGFGVGLRHPHFQYLTENEDYDVDWFEIITENYLDNYGYARNVLDKIRINRPIVMHGVSMNLGDTKALDFKYLKKLKALAQELEPAWISDHLCWTGINGINSHDLLPLPLNEESLNHVADKILQVQDFLKRPLIIENPSTYLEFASSDIPEWEFLSALCHKTNCGLLLDVNNVYVSCFNHQWNAEQYIHNIPIKSVVQIHLAGHSHFKDVKIDTHDHPVLDQVWDLYEKVITLNGDNISTLLEWDANIPSFDILINEIAKARTIADKCQINNPVT